MKLIKTFQRNNPFSIGIGKRFRRISDKLIRLLEDEDRVVRESACLSLAHMKCTQAVPNIVDLW